MVREENPTVDCRESPTLSISHAVIGRPVLSKSITDRLPEVSVGLLFSSSIDHYCSV